MKKQEQGFVLMETLIVSAFLIGILVYLFLQFSNIKRSYDISFRYNTIPGLYQANEIVKYLSTEDTNTLFNTISTVGYAVVEDCSMISKRTYCENLMQFLHVKKAILVPDNLENLKKELGKNNPFDEEMYQYINRLDTDSTIAKRIVVEFTDNTFASILVKEV